MICSSGGEGATGVTRVLITIFSNSWVEQLEDNFAFGIGARSQLQLIVGE
jgi:hypothetical protein